MKNASVRHKKTGKEGHIFNFIDSELISSKKYFARFKGSGGGYVCEPSFGKELELIIKK